MACVPGRAPRRRACMPQPVSLRRAEAWENYRVRAAVVIARFGGRYFVRGAQASECADSEGFSGWEDLYPRGRENLT